MKKALILFSLILLLLLTGCGRETAVPETTAPPTADTPVPTPEPWVPTDTPAIPAYSNGAETLQAILDPTYSWHYVDDEGKTHDFESSGLSPQLTDWLDGTYPILRAEGDVQLSFPCRMPEAMSLTAFSPKGAVPVELRDGTFTPYAGINAYQLSVSWKRGKPVTRSQARYILLVEGNGSSSLPETDSGISLTLLDTDSRGCRFILENQNGRNFYLGGGIGGLSGGYYALFRRTGSGDWEWLKPRRYAAETFTELPWGKSREAELDWSRSQGTLEPGEYAILFCGGLQNSKPYAPDSRILLPVCFTLKQAELPEPPGPLTPAEPPKGLSAAMEQRSPHRWTQTITSAGEIPCAVDRNFFLYRLEGNGALTYILPEYTLPSALNSPLILSRAGSQTADVELAAAYGELQAGDYLLRRRVYLMESWTVLDSELLQNWRASSEDRIGYLDTVFTLSSPLSDVLPDVDPCPISHFLDPTPDPDLPISIAGSIFDAAGFQLSLKNLGEDNASFGDCVLYFLWEGEWLPLELSQPGWPPAVRKPEPQADRTGPGDLRPGESLEAYAPYSPYYGTLEPGTYRLVMSVIFLDEEGYYTERTQLTADFTILADGTGVFLEN